jgi:hypothetical protein
MALVKDALRLLNKKAEAIIQTAASETGITAAAVSDLVIKMNVEDLTAQVAGYVANGHLTPAEVVAADSYLVAEEFAADGTLANPRIQFRLDSQDKATQDALMGKKAGDSISFGGDKLSAKVLEIYSLVTPKAPEAPAAEAAPEAPAAEDEGSDAPAADANDVAPAAEAAAEAPAAESDVTQEATA